eukprot:scaffold1204_cov313-Pavlova_lutheri.AAC.7
MDGSALRVSRSVRTGRVRSRGRHERDEITVRALGDGQQGVPGCPPFSMSIARCPRIAPRVECHTNRADLVPTETPLDGRLGCTLFRTIEETAQGHPDPNDFQFISPFFSCALEDRPSLACGWFGRRTSTDVFSIAKQGMERKVGGRNRPLSSRHLIPYTCRPGRCECRTLASSPDASVTLVEGMAALSPHHGAVVPWKLGFRRTRVVGCAANPAHVVSCVPGPAPHGPPLPDLHVEAHPTLFRTFVDACFFVYFVVVSWVPRRIVPGWIGSVLG